jgi:PAS domain S-box-containing protein
MLLLWIYIHPEDANINILIGWVIIVITMIFARQILALKESNQIKELLENNQEILKKRERHLSLITDNMVDLITRTDPNGVYQYVSPSARKIIGYEPENLLGKNVLDFVHPDDLDKFKIALIKSKESGYLDEPEYRYKKSTGDYVWLETVGTPIFGHENKLKGFIRSSRDIDDRKYAEEQIKASLEEKEVLLKEIHHRVKNNMQIISSLLSLQSRNIKGGKELEIFKESQNRVKSMAMIHENLYRTPNLARINFKDYIQNLISGLFMSYGINQDTVKTEMDLNNILLDIDTAIPCGLILNELMSNSLKHAFPEGKKGKINISLLEEGNKLKMIVGDDGSGFPDEIDFRNTDSLGLKLINTLVNQLKGEIELEKSKGTKFIIKFEKK